LAEGNLAAKAKTACRDCVFARRSPSSRELGVLAAALENDRAIRGGGLLAGAKPSSDVASSAEALGGQGDCRSTTHVANRNAINRRPREIVVSGDRPAGASAADWKGRECGNGPLSAHRALLPTLGRPAILSRPEYTGPAHAPLPHRMPPPSDGLGGRRVFSLEQGPITAGNARRTATFTASPCRRINFRRSRLRTNPPMALLFPAHSFRVDAFSPLERAEPTLRVDRVPLRERASCHSLRT